MIRSGEDNQVVPTNGEEERERPRVDPNARDNLDFGWFALPRDGNKGSQAQKSECSAASQGGLDPYCGNGPDDATNEDNQPTGVIKRGSRPPSQHGRPGSHQGRPGSHYGRRGNQHGRPGSQHGRPGSQHGSSRPPSQGAKNLQQEPGCAGVAVQPSNSNQTSQCLVVEDERDQKNTEDSINSRGQDQAQPLLPEIDAVDWPLSRAAQEMMMRAARPPSEPAYMTHGKPRCRVQERDVPTTPPTPLPPLTLQGYRGSGRPTFASWSDQWHRSQQYSHPRDQPGPCHMYNNSQGDFNNNNSSNNSNNNNDMSSNAYGRDVSVFHASDYTNNSACFSSFYTDIHGMLTRDIVSGHDNYQTSRDAHSLPDYDVTYNGTVLQVIKRVGSGMVTKCSQLFSPRSRTRAVTTDLGKEDKSRGYTVTNGKAPTGCAKPVKCKRRKSVTTVGPSENPHKFNSPELGTEMTKDFGDTHGNRSQKEDNPSKTTEAADKESVGDKLRLCVRALKQSITDWGRKVRGRPSKYHQFHNDVE